MKSEIAILFDWAKDYSDIRHLSLRQRFRSYESFRVSGRYSATYGPIGWDFDKLSSIFVYLAKFQVSRPYLGCTLRFTAEK